MMVVSQLLMGWDPHKAWGLNKSIIGWLQLRSATFVPAIIEVLFSQFAKLLHCQKHNVRVRCMYHNLGFPFRPEFIIVIFIHYKPRIAAAILDLQWMKMIWCG